jgi:hypothetical protein
MDIRYFMWLLLIVLLIHSTPLPSGAYLFIEIQIMDIQVTETQIADIQTRQATTPNNRVGRRSFKPRASFSGLVDRERHAVRRLAPRAASTTIWSARSSATRVGYRDRHTASGGDG